MPLPLCVLPGIFGAGERVAPGGGAENRRDGRMISAPTEGWEPGRRAECCRPAAVRLPGPTPFCRGGYQPPVGAHCEPLGKDGEPGQGADCRAIPRPSVCPVRPHFVGAAISRPQAHAVRPYEKWGANRRAEYRPA